MHSGAKDYSREEIVKQIKSSKDSSVYSWRTYIPIGNSVEKLQKWKSQGVHILYLTSRIKPREVENIKSVLKKHGFPEGQLLFRQKGEEFKDVAEKNMPDILIEDDCESIGGAEKMIITNIKPDLKKRIHSVVVKEFEGLDHLPDDLSNLKLF